MEDVALESRIPAIASISMLLLAVFGHWPYGFYTLLRLLICVSAIYLALRARRLRKDAWLWLMAGMSLIFNPVFPVPFARATWQALDVMAVIVFEVSITAIRQRLVQQPTSQEAQIGFPRRNGVNPSHEQRGID